MSKEPVELENEITHLGLPEHKILLSFNNDSGAEAFYDWWHFEGKELFDEHCERIDD